MDSTIPAGASSTVHVDGDKFIVGFLDGSAFTSPNVLSPAQESAGLDGDLPLPPPGPPEFEGIRCLDEAAFRHFRPLLAASQTYASYSGCRFRPRSFDGISPRGNRVMSARDVGSPRSGTALLASSASQRGNVHWEAPFSEPTVSSQRARDSGPRLAAKIYAAPTVREFAARVLAGEAGLVEEVDRAFRIVMVESVRNAMMGMFKALDMFPPRIPPTGIDDEDCAYEDVTAPLPIIAQRLYNDEARRLTDTTGGPGRLEKRASTAAFVVDFAEVIGVQLPPIPETQHCMLKEFSERASDFARYRSQEAQSHARNAFLQSLGVSAAANALRSEVNTIWAQNRESMLLLAGAAFAGAAGLAVTAYMNSRERDQSCKGS
eukprot:TRINITY_DN45313_c0_g1_i1.p1 TRINITY_DN45313_c0_g1~~TRINITY_DN45313_c0_g1_i1.p1  ORF type:complete len:376 (+),score=48.22 TRINITY_DN45313_c0_g1_i1:53-1180(+)